MKGYRIEFPDFDDTASCAALVAAGWQDRSWHNEACPSFQRGVAYIMVDYLDRQLAESGPEFEPDEYLAQRFLIGRCKADGEDLGTWENTRTLPEALEVAARFQVEALATAFGKVLTDWLTEDQMGEVRTRNATPDYAECCASHDFCDANMAMLQAFEATFEREPRFLEGTDEKGDHSPEQEADLALFNEAWTLAKSLGFAEVVA